MHWGPHSLPSEKQKQYFLRQWDFLQQQDVLAEVLAFLAVDSLALFAIFLGGFGCFAAYTFSQPLHPQNLASHFLPAW